MIQAFYNAAVGAQQQMLRLNVQANNIANVNHYGFRAEKPAFEALMYRNIAGADGAELPKGAGTRVVSTATDFSQAALEETGRAQDYAIFGLGFFALFDPSTQEISFTRDGSFSPAMFQEQNEAGELEHVWYLSDGEGRQVLNTGGYPIVMTDFNAEQPVGVFLIQYQDGLQHLDSGRFLAGDKNGDVWMGGAQVLRGYLETSNTDLAYEISKVIEAQRAYSYALRMVTTADEVETTINGLTGA
ncbi:flagellar hook basal-body protein [uncultured Intestinimonas sp.]|mgnify:FL=1|uniref:flagellar hook-basal body protein n=1 Tax=uncultured Intestinimonas sp. TaxID=1689265 RepID=UPI0025F8F3BC|nr:flagellar hook basal-body protein [uncultured Intestinimonas sp.]